MASKIRFVVFLVLLPVFLLALPQPGAAAFHDYADLVLGQADYVSNSANQGAAPASDTLNAPQIVLLNAQGSLFVADTLNNRVLRYDPPLSSGQPASLVLGQANFSDSASNRGQPPTSNSLSLPDGLALDASGNLYVADFGNNRVLRFSPPFSNGMDASLVLGQANFTANSPNRGAASPGAGTLYRPVGLVVGFDGALVVVDNSNSRVLHFPFPLSNGMDADLVLGQVDFTSGCANRCAPAAANSLSTPTGLAQDASGNLFVVDSYNHRLLKFGAPFVSGMDASLVLGQANFTANSPNRGASPAAGSLSEPHDVSVDDWGNVFVADYGNHRLLEYNNPSTNGVNANRLFGQQAWTENIPNNSGISSASLYNPVGVALDSQGNLFTADRNNNRILRFPQPVAPGAPALAELFPNVIAASGPEFSLQVSGSGFMPNSVVRWNGSDRVTAYISSRKLAAILTAADIQSAGGGNVTIFTPAPGGGLTAPFSLTIYQRAAYDPTADQVFGQANFVGHAKISGASGLNEPAYLAVDAYDRLYVADTKNNRILRYSRPFYNGQAADLVIGQIDFFSTQPNRGGPAPAANTLAGPAGLAFDSLGALYVSDSGNNRVLIFNPPFTSGMDASIVIGQDDFTKNLSTSGPASLSSPQGLAVNASGKLIVADSQHNRVLVFYPPFTSGELAVDLFGQNSFFINTPNKGNPAPDATTLWGPQFVLADGEYFFVGDVGNNRIIKCFPGYPAAGLILGQPGPNSNTAYGPGAQSILSPGGMALDSHGNLYVSDWYNRVLIFHAPLSGWMSASQVIGQSDFSAYEILPASANSFNKPMGLALDSMGYLFTADRDNSRVIEFDHPLLPLAPQIGGLSSSVLAVNSPDVSLTVVGSNFEASSVVRWNGAARPTSLIASTELHAIIPAASLGAPGSNVVSVFTPAPGGGVSAGMTVTMYTPTAFDRLADVVLGQGDFSQHAANRFGVASTGLALPRGAVLDAQGNLYIADNANKRVLRYDAPLYTGKSASLVLGSPSMNLSGWGVLNSAGFSDPVAVALDKNGLLYVADYGFHRVLRFSPPFTDGMAADLVLGQSDFSSSSSTPSAAVLGGPAGLAFDKQGSLYVADLDANRILRFDAPFSSGMSASLVLGQSSFTAVSPNAGGSASGAVLSSPLGLAFDNFDSLFVADELNNRVLEFKRPFSSGMNASLVLGQGDFYNNAVNRGLSPAANTLSNPTCLVVDATGALFVADYGNHRVLKYAQPQVNGAPAIAVLGQPDLTTVSISGGTSDSSIFAPLGLALDAAGRLYVADAFDNRLLIFDLPLFRLFAPAIRH